MTRLPSPDVNVALPLTVEAGHRLHPVDPCATYPSHHVWDCHPTPCSFAEFPWDSRTGGARATIRIPAHALAPGSTYVLSYRVAFHDPLAHTMYSDARELRLQPRLLPLLPHLLPNAASVPPRTPYRVSAGLSRDPSPFAGGGLTFHWSVCAIAAGDTCTPFAPDHPFAAALPSRGATEFELPGTDWVGVARITLVYAHAASNRTSQAQCELTYGPFTPNATLHITLNQSVGEKGRYSPRALAPLGLYPQWVQTAGPGRRERSAEVIATARLSCSYTYEWTSPDVLLSPAVLVSAGTDTWIHASNQDIHIFLQQAQLQNFSGPHLHLLLEATPTAAACHPHLAFLCRSSPQAACQLQVPKGCRGLPPPPPDL